MRTSSSSPRSVDLSSDDLGALAPDRPESLQRARKLDAHREKLAGMANAWRLRPGSYRVVYTVDDREQVVTVTRVGRRREAYRRR